MLRTPSRRGRAAALRRQARRRLRRRLDTLPDPLRSSGASDGHAPRTGGAPSRALYPLLRRGPPGACGPRRSPRSSSRAAVCPAPARCVALACAQEVNRPPACTGRTRGRREPLRGPLDRAPTCPTPEWDVAPVNHAKLASPAAPAGAAAGSHSSSMALRRIAERSIVDSWGARASRSLQNIHISERTRRRVQSSGETSADRGDQGRLCGGR
jgi:hypothetical protein